MKKKWNALNTAIGWWLIPSEYYEVSLPRLRTALESIGHKLFSCKRIDTMLAEMKISCNDIEADKIKKLVDLRNKIVHESYTPKNEKEDDELWEAILLSREILVRVVFSMLGFKGTYFCYLGGAHLREFPSCQRINKLV